MERELVQDQVARKAAGGARVGREHQDAADSALDRDAHLGAAETTALFVYLHQLANPNDLVAMEEWLKCKDDYVTYNKARQADWHERRAFGHQGSGKLQRNRFARQKTAQSGPLEDLDPKTVDQRLLTMRRHNEQRTGYQRKRPAPETAIVPRPIAPPPPATPVQVNTKGDELDENCPF